VDPLTVVYAAEEVFLGSGAALTDAWSVRQFEYPWLHSHAHIHRFLDGHQDALDFAAQKAGLELTAAGRLMAAWLELKPEH
jgi:2-haloacid dehalogenase